MGRQRSSFILVAVASAALGLALPACSGNGNAPAPVTSANLQSNVLQLAVGSANVGGTPGLNVVTTYRQPKGAYHPGDSAVAVDSPTFTGPFTLSGAAGSPDAFFSTIVTGPAPSEAGSNAMTATGQNATNVTTFGTSGGVVGLGIEPYNYNGTGVPDNVAPYPVPVYTSQPADQIGIDVSIPWGGPPAFDPNGDGEGTRDGNAYPAGQLGISEGLDVFGGLAPAAGAYTLRVSVPANTGTVTQQASATITSTALLPPVTAPSPSYDGAGGASFGVTLPAGVTQAYLQVVDVGLYPGSPALSCNGSSETNPTYYTIAVSASGSVTLPDSDGPLSSSSTRTPTVCTAVQNAAANPQPSPSPGATAAPTVPPNGDRIAVEVIGFDYPAFAASYPSSLGNPSPTIAGPSGQSDITISPYALCLQPAAGGVSCSVVETASRTRRLPPPRRR